MILKRTHGAGAAIFTGSFLVLLLARPGSGLADDLAGGWQTKVIRAAAAPAAVEKSGSAGTKNITTGALSPDALEGIASYYRHGEMTASGEPYDKRALTAAHRTLPFNSHVRVTDKSSGKSV